MASARILLGNEKVYHSNRDALVIDLASQRIHGFSRHKVGPVAMRLLTTLFLRVGTVTPYDLIIEAIWGDREDGGPENPKRSLDATLSTLRPALLSAGFTVVTVWGRGLILDPVHEMREAA